MTREEAIEILKTDGCYECYVETDNPYVCNNGGCEIREAYYMAIEALEQKRGEWKYDGTYYICSACNGNSYTNSFNYCPNCGAKMDEREEEEWKEQ